MIKCIVNDLGMAIANALAAARAGVSFVDCTVGGIRERAGNCNFYDNIYYINDLTKAVSLIIWLNSLRGK